MDNGYIKREEHNFHKRKRVMIFDVFEFFRVMIRNIISTHDYEVVGEFQDGKLAAEFYNANSSQIDYIIWGIWRPAMDGIDFLQNIQKNDMCKLVVISPCSQIPTIIYAIKHGADYFLVKPFSPEKLIDVLTHTDDSYFSISNLDKYIAICNTMNCYDGEVLSQDGIDKIQQLDDSIEGRTESERIRINSILAQSQSTLIMARQQCLSCGNRIGDSCKHWDYHLNIHSDSNCSNFISIEEFEEQKRENEKVCCENCIHWSDLRYLITNPTTLMYYEPQCTYTLVYEGDTVCPENPSKCLRFVALNDHEGREKLIEEELTKLMLYEEEETNMELQIINGDFSICKVAKMEDVDFSQELLFFAKTPDEISLVCESEYIPPKTLEVEHGWKALKISGILDFGLVGVVAKISNILADIGISIFVISTYNTDYILLKSESFVRGLRELVRKGYIVNED